MKSFKTSRIIASILLIAMLFTVSPVSFANTQQYPAYEFVVTANNTSVKTGDTLILTVTVNGPAKYANALQYNINYATSDFTAPTKAADAFEADWYAGVKAGEGFGAIARPGYSNKNGVIKVNYLDQYGENYVDSDSTSEVVGKIVFTAARDIDDIAACFTLSEAKHAYGTDEGPLRTVNEDETKVVQLSETMAVTKVTALIDAIGTPVTYSSKAAIEAARSAYDAITSDSVKAQIANIDTLIAAEAALKVITDEVDRVKALIDALDSTKDTFEADITEAETAYNALGDDAKAALADYDAKIKAAKDELAQIKQEQDDRAEAAKVVALIDAIGTVTLSSEQDILAAQNAYNELTQAQKQYVDNYADLEKAAADYNTLLNNWEAAQELKELIESIPATITNKNVEEARNAINTARSSYNSAGDAIRNFIGDDVYSILTKAEAALVVVDNDIAAAKEVEKLIDELGEISLASDAKLAAIADKLSTLSESAYSYVSEDKMVVYNSAKEKYEALYAEEMEIQAVIAKIDALGSVEDIELEDKVAVEEAELALSQLDAAVQDRVTNAQVLRDIRTRLNALIKSEADVNNVIRLIGEIGEVTLSSNAKINAARTAYEKLTDDEKSRVNNYEVLTAAEEVYNELFADAEQEKIDREAAQGVDDLIAAIGEVVLSPECESAIKAAEDAYEGLTDAQKALVKNLDVLQGARSDYDGLVAEQAKVEYVISIIDAIGTVEYTEACLARIEDAEYVYDSLENDLKERVTNSDKIAIAREKYNQLKADAEAVRDVIDAIDAIGEVSWSEESLSKIEAARTAYNALRDDLKELVTNIQILVDAEKAYESLKPVFNQKEDIVSYGGNHMTVITNVPENVTVSDSTTEAALVKIGENVYHIFVTDYVVKEEDIILKDVAPATLELGNVDGGERLTANDLQLASQYAARNQVDVFETDPLAFVRADVNGSGSITAIDVLMIANKILGNPVDFTLFVGALQN